VQAVAYPQDLDAGQFGVARPRQPLQRARRENEAAAIGQFNDHPAGAAIVTGPRRLGLGGRATPAPRQGAVDVAIQL
jgi:hypothetical protein